MTSPTVKALSWGIMEIPDVGNGKDFKLWPGGGREWNWGETGTRHRPGIQVSDIEELITKGATVVVLSRGFENKLRVDAGVLDYLADKNVSVHIAATPEAVTMYNSLAGTTLVGGLFHSTC
ncbi:hypothetical protein JDV02_004230 [Purpureocillium takamizusanense]|uniref:Mth938 domain-containing protein n=1 Tax=Purpureocillium takamizusanense TaxID=2060973 RepID=A0A9Q8QEB1_9HYPO|nr:uncharacterized protein JDV02_004230 [Purpureocillium takamizusanense]UNI17923.1 hypothetical protein JDV02_004230 [Purpureocillium takamizusanense]